MNNLEQLEATFDVKISPGVLKEAMKEAGASKGDLWKLPFDQLRIIDGFNLRVHNAQYTAKIEEYAETLFNEGWFAHKPMSELLQRDEATGKSQVFIFDGHTRLLSIPLANNRITEWLQLAAR